MPDLSNGVVLRISAPGIVGRHIGLSGPQGPTGATGATGPTGADGKTWLSGTTAPAGGIGVVGDWYLDTVTADIYEKTGAATWTLRLNIEGPTGPTGATGPAGPAGAGSGDVIGPAAATDNAVARFDLTTGKLLQNSGVTIDDSGNIATAGTVDGRDVGTDGAKLDGIAAGATANRSDAATDTLLAAKAPTASPAFTTSATLDGQALVKTNDTRLADARTPTAHTHIKADITDLGTIGTAAAKNTGTASGDVPLLGAGGVLAVARLATGTPDGTKFIRDDGTLAVPAGGGGAGALLATVTRTATSGASYSIANASSADIDATNLAITFTPTTTSAKIVFEGLVSGTGASSQGFLSLRVGSTDVAGSSRCVTYKEAAALAHRRRTSFHVTGLTVGTPVTYKLAGRTTSGTMVILYGITANNEHTSTTLDVTYGPITLEAYSA